MFVCVSKGISMPRMKDFELVIPRNHGGICRERPKRHESYGALSGSEEIKTRAAALHGGIYCRNNGVRKTDVQLNVAGRTGWQQQRAGRTGWEQAGHKEQAGHNQVAFGKRCSVD